jgi:hypothetical protein
MRCRQGDLLRHRPYNAADAVLFLKTRDHASPAQIVLSQGVAPKTGLVLNNS